MVMNIIHGNTLIMILNTKVSIYQSSWTLSCEMISHTDPLWYYVNNKYYQDSPKPCPPPNHAPPQTMPPILSMYSDNRSDSFNFADSSIVRPVDNILTYVTLYVIYSLWDWILWRWLYQTVRLPSKHGLCIPDRRMPGESVQRRMDWRKLF